MNSLYSSSQEALLVSLARNGDQAAFAELVSRRGAGVRSLLRRSSNNAALADDLAQQTFLRAWVKLKQLKQADRFGSWLRQLAINEWLQHIRKHDALALSDTVDDESLATNQTRPDIARDLEEALKQLPTAARLCVVLSYQEGMSHREVSDATGLAAGTVKSHIRRGTQTLKRLLSDYNEEVGNEPGE